MGGRLDGFYYALWEGLNDGGGIGQGLVTLKEGKVYGGDSVSCFLGEYEDQGNTLLARVRVFPMIAFYLPVTGQPEDQPWDLPDIRGSIQEGELPLQVETTLDAQRYQQPDHQEVSIYLKRISLI